MPVYFHSEDTHFELKEKKLYKRWIESVVCKHHKTVQNLNIIFSSNKYLLEINKKYLNHHYHTDVITFNYNDGNCVSGDIFVSVDQVKLNSQEQKVSFISELSRVIIHGVLHLLNYDDDTDDSKKEIRKMEDWALNYLGGLDDGKTI